jgi:hypothetical protein
MASHFLGEELGWKSKAAHLSHGITTNDVHNEIHALVSRGHTLDSVSPVGHLIVINDMVSPQPQ